ncbi:MAG: GNAT family N-acetyltransferase [Chloroflexota bacterium]
MIALRPVDVTDIDVFYDHQADPVAAAMAGVNSRDRAAHVEHWATVILANPSNVTRTVTVDGVVAGNIGSWIDQDGKRLVGYVYGRELWGRGIATDALRQFLDQEMTERPLYAHVANSNLGSQRVLEKSGFVRTSDHAPVEDDGRELLLYRLG